MNKRFLLVLVAVLVLFAFGIAGAYQIDGLKTGNGPGLPKKLVNFVNPGGLGDALIYNYFNARNGMITYFSVVNTGELNGSRARIRFYEAADVAGNHDCIPSEPRGSFEILDFDLCLSKGDIWSGYIMQDGDHGVLCSDDNDTNIIISDDPSAPVTPWTARGFANNCVSFKYGTANIETAILADHTLEGYFVVIGERQANPGYGYCGDIAGSDVKNALAGNVVMIDDTNSFGYNAVAIGDFADADITGAIASKNPELGDGKNGLSGINYILTKSDLFQVYRLLDGGATDYILTSPTKKLSQLCGPANDIFDDTSATFTSWDDEEQTRTRVCEFSPCPPTEGNNLPYEVNIIRLSRQDPVAPLLLTTVLAQDVDPQFNFGWFRINLADQTTTHFTRFGAQRSNGWPILGLAIGSNATQDYMVTVPMWYKNSVENMSTP